MAMFVKCAQHFLFFLCVHQLDNNDPGTEKKYIFEVNILLYIDLLCAADPFQGRR